MNPNSNAVYAQAYVQTPEHPVCIVCGMDPDPSLKSDDKGKTYYFCSQGHKQTFDDSPEQFTKG